MFYLWSVVCVGLVCAGLAAAQMDVTIQCSADSVTVRVGLNPGVGLSLDINGLLLGSCPPQLVGGVAVFQSGLLDCRFMRIATANVTMYINVLTYMPSSGVTQLFERIVCSTYKAPDWIPPLYNPVLGDADGFGSLEFSMAIVKDDFSGPRVSSTFFLGSLIFIKAMVAQQSHMPLELFLEECVAANSANLSASNQTYPIISNYGCFVDGQVSSSKFLHSANLWELHLQVQAFKFTDADVYIHCGLVAWDPQGPNDPTKKVCNFNQDTKRWEYLDMSSQNSLCSCCNTNCQQRKRREAGDQNMRYSAVLGPVRIVPVEHKTPAPVGNESAVPLVTPYNKDWLPFLAAPVVILAILVALSLGYFCKCHHALQPQSNKDLLIPTLDE